MKYREWFLAGMLVVALMASTTSPAFASFTTIDVPGAVRTEAYGINENGQIVGFYFDGARFHGFLLD